MKHLKLLTSFVSPSTLDFFIQSDYLPIFILRNIKNSELLRKYSETAVQITWEKSSTNNVTGYEIQYTTKKYYFGSSNEVQSMSLDVSTGHAEITGLTSGEKYCLNIKKKTCLMLMEIFFM